MKLLALLSLVSLFAPWGCAHEFVVATDPPGATVTVAGAAVGTTPVELSPETLESAAKGGYLTLIIKKTGFSPLNLAIPSAPASHRIGIALKPFREAALSTKPGSVQTPRWDALERDLATLMRQQGKLIIGEAVEPLDLARWRKLYPDSGAAPFLEGLRLFEAGKRDESLTLLKESIRRNEKEVDYRVVASSVAAGPGGEE